MQLFRRGGSRDAARRAEEQQQMQQVANDRQLAELRRQDSTAQPSRRRPRGRRLFAEDGGKTTLS